jgi:hypothetical protein
MRVRLWRWGLYVLIPSRLHVVVSRGGFHACRAKGDPQ